MLKALRVSFLIPAAVAGAAILPLVGCDKKDGTANPTAGASNKSSVGIIDYDRVFTDVGWKGELDRSLQVTQQDYTMALQLFVRDVQKAVEDKKKDLATKARLKEPQITELNKEEKLDQLPLTTEQKQELFATLQNRNYYLQQANAYAGGMLRQRQGQLLGLYKQALNPVVRRVAEANGVSVVLIPVDNVAYYNGNTADISSKVVDEFQKSPPPRNIPDAPKLAFPKVESISAPPPPTTAPAALPAATQPVSPIRGG